MRGVSGNNVLNTGAGGTFNQDGILIVPIIDAERVLAIDAKGIDQFKEGEYFSDDLPGPGVNIFFSFELLSGEEMKIRDLLRCQAARDLFVGNGTEDNGAILELGLTPLKDIHNDIGIEDRSHTSLRRSSLASSRVIVCGRMPKRDSAISTLS